MGFAYCHPMSALVAKSGHGHPQSNRLIG
jgi:hypothetical protein